MIDGSATTAHDETLLGLMINVDPGIERVAEVGVEGELDLSTRGEFEETIKSLIDTGDARTVVLDLSKLTFMDSTGLRAMWVVRQHALAQHAMLVLRSPSPTVMRLLRMTRLHKVFQIDGVGEGELATD